MLRLLQRSRRRARGCSQELPGAPVLLWLLLWKAGAVPGRGRFAAARIAASSAMRPVPCRAGVAVGKAVPGTKGHRRFWSRWCQTCGGR